MKMEEFEAQKIIENLENIAAEKGANALTGEVIEECCRANGVDPEDFRNFIYENIDLQEIKELQGLEELSLEKLDQVAGGAQPVKRGIASFLAVASLLGSAANFAAPTALANANQNTNTAKHGGDKKKQEHNQKTKINAALLSTALAVPLIAWAWAYLFSKNANLPSYAPLEQSRHADYCGQEMTNFASKISEDIQEIYNSLLVDECPQIGKGPSEDIVGKIADLMLHKIKDSPLRFGLEFKSEDPSVKIPGSDSSIKVSTFLRDYIRVMLYGRQSTKATYDLAAYVMALYSSQRSMWSLPLGRISNPNDPDYAFYEKILTKVNQALKLDICPLKYGILSRIRERQLREEKIKKERIEIIEGLMNELMEKSEDSKTEIEKEMCELYKPYKQKRESGWPCATNLYRQLIYIDVLNEKRIAKELENQGKESNAEALKHINNLQESFKDHKTIFEKYLIEVCDYFKGKIKLNAEYENLNKTKLKFAIKLNDILKYLGELAHSSKYSQDKTRFLKKLEFYLINLMGLLTYQFENCHENDKETLHHLLEKTYVFYSIVYSSETYHGFTGADYVKVRYDLDGLPANTDREFLQVLFNDDYTNKEMITVHKALAHNSLELLLEHAMFLMAI